MEPEVCGSASEILIFFVTPNQDRIQIRNYRGNRVEADSGEVLPESITSTWIGFPISSQIRLESEFFVESNWRGKDIYKYNARGRTGVAALLSLVLDPLIAALALVHHDGSCMSSVSRLVRPAGGCTAQHTRVARVPGQPPGCRCLHGVAQGVLRGSLPHQPVPLFTLLH
jgi:hypothetical protein